MDIIIDLILCAIIAIGIVFGIKRGFIKLTAKPVKFVCALIIAFSFCSGFASAFVTPMIEAPISNYVRDFLYENCSALTSENIGEELPTLIKIAAATFGVDVNEVASNAGGEIVEAIVLNLTGPVVSVISTVLSFVGLYIISKILLNIAFWLLNLLFSGGVFGLLNKILGCVFGTALSVLLAWGIAVVLEIVFHLPVFEGNEMIASFEGGYVYKFFNTYNPIELLLSF